MKVLKFGGSVLKNGEDVENIEKIITRSKGEDKVVVCVFSAFYGITNQLLELVKKASKGEDYGIDFEELKSRHTHLLDELNIAEEKQEVEEFLTKLEHILITISDTGVAGSEALDFVLSFGERLSSFTIYKFLSKRHLAFYVKSSEIIKTDSTFGYAKVDVERTEEQIKRQFEGIKEGIVVCAGFIGSDADGRITTLGRNGSDYSAAIIAGALNADCLEIWKDTNGLYTADPKIVKEPMLIKNITYQEMMELSALGNKVVHMNAIFPCVRKKIPIFLKNCYNVENFGTKISNEKEENCVVNGIVKFDGVYLLRFKIGELSDATAFLIKMQKIIKKFENSIITISQNIKQRLYSLVVMKDGLEKIGDDFNENLKEFFDKSNVKMDVSEEMSMISVVGPDLSSILGVAGRLFDAVYKNGIIIDGIHDDFSATRISFLCQKKDASRAVEVLHDEFIKF